MIVLGLNFRHGDASASLIKDGKILTAVEEERFVKIKNCSQFPINSIKYCLVKNNISIDQVDLITTNFNSSYNFKEKIFYVIKNFYNLKIIKQIFKRNNRKTIINEELELFFGKNLSEKIKYIPHHLSHVLSTFYLEGRRKNSLVYSFDGSGDFSTIESYIINNKSIKMIDKSNFPNSLGFFYTTFTQFLGFPNYGDEYKVMGLAAYGKPIYANKIKKNLIKKIFPLKLNLKYFNYPQVSYYTLQPIIKNIFNKNFIELFGKPIKDNNFNIKQIYKDIAASVQKVFEDIVLFQLKEYKKKYNLKDVYLTGGCANNSLLVGKIVQSKLFNKVHIGQSSGDAGGAIGSAFYPFIKKGITIKTNKELSFRGPSFNNNFIKKNLVDKIEDKNKYKITLIKNNNKLINHVVKKLIKEKIIFWFQNGMEFGPRALGNRSILADPRKKNIIKIINSKVKNRELFRPLAPVVLKDYAKKYFYMFDHESKYMNIVFKAKDITKKKLPSIVHKDQTSRVQTIAKSENIRLFSLIKKFHNFTKTPMLINTSLNLNEPIIMNPHNAFYMFNQTNIKTLVLNNWVIEKL